MYTYDNTEWGDLLTSYDGEPLYYDTIGNLIRDANWDYTWEQGRQLTKMKHGFYAWEFTYDSNGMRTSRTSGTTTYHYVYNGSQLVQMTVGTDILYFTYDASGAPVVVDWNGTPYYYVTSFQGDVQMIMNLAGEVVVLYVYDAWGNIVATDGELATTLGELNPLRYRGYVFDQDTGLYYLQSRYYNPEWGRFINADAFVSTGQGILGNNMFAYCRNNPVRRIDASGTLDYEAADCDADGDLREDIGFLPAGNVNSANNPNSSTNAPSNGSLNTANGPNGNQAANNTVLGNPLHTITYTLKVINDMKRTDFHGFSLIVDNYGSYGELSQTKGGDQQLYSTLRIPGEYLGHSGYFEYMWNSNRICNHRCFIARDK